MALVLSLLGETQIRLDSKPIENLSAIKAQALLFYLAVEQGHAHRRDSLAEMFWPEKPPGYGRNNLKQALSILKKTLGDSNNQGPYIISSKRDLQFNTGSPHQVDALDLEKISRTIKRHAHQELHNCEECYGQLIKATKLYRDDFLWDFYLPDSPEFNEWTLTKREYFRRLAMETLVKLYSIHEAKGEYKKAVPYARELVDLEPWSESSHRRLMKLLAASGKRSAALKQYQVCKTMLAEEFDAQPTAETTALYQHIKNHRTGSDIQEQEYPAPAYPDLESKALSEKPGPVWGSWIKASAVLSALVLVSILYLVFYREVPEPTGTPLTGLETEQLRVENQTNSAAPTDGSAESSSADGNKRSNSAAVILADPDHLCLEGEKLLYREDFQDNQAQGWPEIMFRAQDWDIVPDPESPENLVIQNPGVYEVGTYLDGYTFEDAVFRSNFYLTGRPEYIFIWHHYPEEYESKFGTIHSSDYSIAFLDGGTYFHRFAEPLPNVNLLAIQLAPALRTWHMVEISTFDDILEVWLDGKQLLFYQDPEPLPPGQLGLAVWTSKTADSMVYFDNLTVCELSGPFVSRFNSEN